MAVRAIGLFDDSRPGCTAIGASARLFGMNPRVDHLLHEALELSEEERSSLVVALLDSLEGSPDPSIPEAWRDEVLRRRETLREGSVRAVLWADAKARLGALK